MNKWIIEAILYTVYLIFGAAWATTGSVMPEIMADFGVNVSSAALMSNMILWAKVVGTVCTAILTAKIGAKRSYVLGCILIATSIFIPFISNFNLLLLIRFFGGLGGAICLISLVPTIARFFNNKTASALNSFNCTSNIIGTIIALAFAVYLSTILGGWKNLLALYGYITLALGIIWFFVFTDEAKSSDEKVAKLSKDEKKSLIKYALFNRIVWGMIVQYIGAMIMMIFMFTYLPLYYAKYVHLQQGSLAHLSGSANQIGILVGTFIGPFFKQRGFHYKRWLIVTSMVMAITTFFMLFATNDIVILSCSFLTGALFATWFAFLFSLPKEYIKGANTKMITYTMSVFWFCTFLLVTINSQLIGWSIDLTGGFKVGFIYVFTLMIVPPILAQIIFPKKQIS